MKPYSDSLLHSAAAVHIFLILRIVILGADIGFSGKKPGSLPAARLYAWRDKTDPFSDGRVHAKVAVADGRVCFITSANLTGHAMEKNMEAGVLISGGHIPRLLDDHLRSLVDTKLVSPV